ncbi:MAG: DUF4349 domain-containing protein [Actinobacteria bacterium]|nr:DUF4349 domain-containing protein [Actinomycetota bacterium]
MRRTLIIPTALLLSALALTGCSAGADSSAYDSGGIAAPMPATDTLNQEAGSADGQSTVDRSVITTGWVTITVTDPMDAAAEAARITESVGGRIDSRSEYAPRGGDGGSATLTLRIPSKDLTATLDKLKELGEVQEVSLSATDVTMESQDLDARITSMRASIDRLTALLAGATDTDSLIALETAISDRQGQLESMEAQQRFLADQVSMSTVTLNLVTEQVVADPQPVTFLDGLMAGWNAFVAFFAGLLVVIGVLIPWLVLAGIITAVVIVIIKRRKPKATPPVE